MVRSKKRGQDDVGEGRRAALVVAIATLVGTVLGAGITAFSGWWGADEVADSTIMSAQHQTQEQRDKENRDIVSRVYSDYLKAASVYRDRTERTWLIVEDHREGKMPYSSNLPALTTFNDARRAYQDRVNQLAIYGSFEAWKAHEQIATSMPRGLGYVQVTRPKHDVFETGYSKFVAVFCQEAPPRPKAECGNVRAVGAPR